MKEAVVTDLTPKPSRERVFFDLPPYRISEQAKAALRAVNRRQSRFFATAHLYWFD